MPGGRRDQWVMSNGAHSYICAPGSAGQDLQGLLVQHQHSQRPGHRLELGSLFEAGGARSLFLALTLPFPRAARLAETASDIAGSARIDGIGLARLVTGFFVFGVASLLVGVWRFEQKDF